MYVGQTNKPIKIPEKSPEPAQKSPLNLQKGKDSINFESMLSESNFLKQEEIEKEKRAAGGDFKVGENKNDREFRQQLEKVTGKKQDKLKNKLERDDYLNLLVTQLKYQDPSKPMEHYEMASQMAQFNTVEQLMGVNKVLSEMKKLQNESRSEKLAQYLGKNVEVQGNHLKLNPDGTSNTMKFELPALSSNVIVEIRDEHSKVIKSIPMGALQIGTHKVTWDGTNDKGVLQNSGQYSFNILASSEDGKPLVAKTSYLAKVEGISDIFSGGKLDTNVGLADPAKIIAIRNPEEPLLKNKIIQKNEQEILPRKKIDQPPLEKTHFDRGEQHSLKTQDLKTQNLPKYAEAPKTQSIHGKAY
jgi:flagellar basal-body rod modification protein FlgD